MEKFEYKIEEHETEGLGSLNLKELKNMLNKSGKEGWELIDWECPTIFHWVLVFKRRK